MATLATPLRGTNRDPARPRAVAAWLLACSALVFAMIVVGGVTRLTHSGLSIVEWQPIVGTLPPLDEAQWRQAFELYKKTPEYELVNAGMALDEFKRIFWWEYAHRLLGRLIGAAFLLPFLAFLVRRRIPPGQGWKLAGIFALGGLQGALGWFMVKSGLVDDPRVSPFRLTAHLALAFVILGAMLWTAMSLLASPEARDDAETRSARRWSIAVIALVAGMIVTGGFVAGIRAGFAYNTFPSMAGHVVPPEILMLEPWWRNFFWNMATVQFDHRLVAWSLAIAAPIAWWRTLRATPRTRARVAAHLLVAMLVVQVALGISTLLLVVPLPLAAAHQAGAVVLFALALNLVHALRPRRA